MDVIQNKISEEEFKEFKEMKVVGSLIKFNLPQLQVNAASNASFNLNDD